MAPAASPPARRAPTAGPVAAVVTGPVPEGGGFLHALKSLDVAAQALPGALFAMAALAVALLALASAPLPVQTSRTTAMLVHRRGSIAVAGVAALVMAVATYLLL